MKAFFTNEKRKKQFLTTIFFAGLMIVTSMIIIFMVVQGENAELLENGTQKEVVVIQTYNTGTRKKPSYSMDVAFFTKGEEVAIYQQKDTTNLSDAEKFSNAILTQTFGNKTRFRLGDYKAFHINYIDGNTYSTYKKGDIITIIYLESEPEKGRVLEEIQ